MPSGSFSKNARNVSSVVNQKTCGGNKKGGLAPRATGPVEFRNSALSKQGINFKLHLPGLPCPTTYSNNPGGQCSGGVGSPASTRNRGCRYSVTKNTTPLTLEMALEQGGVFRFQTLFIDDNKGILIDGNAVPRFIVHPDGKIVFRSRVTQPRHTTPTLLETPTRSIQMKNDITMKNDRSLEINNKNTLNTLYNIAVINGAEFINKGKIEIRNESNEPAITTSNNNFHVLHITSGAKFLNDGLIINKQSVFVDGNGNVRHTYLVNATFENSGTIEFNDEHLASTNNDVGSIYCSLSTFTNNNFIFTRSHIRNENGKDVFGIRFFSSEVINKGVITFSKQISGGDFTIGIDMLGGNVTNDGEITLLEQINGGNNTYGMYSAANIINNGNITLNQITGGNNLAGIRIVLENTNLANNGTITFNQPISGGEKSVGITMDIMGTLANTGSITFNQQINGSKDSACIKMDDSSSITNDGSIEFKEPIVNPSFGLTTCINIMNGSNFVNNNSIIFSGASTSTGYVNCIDIFNSSEHRDSSDVDASLLNNGNIIFNGDYPSDSWIIAMGENAESQPICKLNNSGTIDFAGNLDSGRLINLRNGTQNIFCQANSVIKSSNATGLSFVPSAPDRRFTGTGIITIPGLQYYPPSGYVIDTNNNGLIDSYTSQDSNGNIVVNQGLGTDYSLGPAYQDQILGSESESVLIGNENQPTYLFDLDNNGSVDADVVIEDILNTYGIDPNPIPIDTNDDGVDDSTLGELIN